MPYRVRCTVWLSDSLRPSRACTVGFLRRMRVFRTTVLTKNRLFVYDTSIQFVEVVISYKIIAISGAAAMTYSTNLFKYAVAGHDSWLDYSPTAKTCD